MHADDLEKLLTIGEIAEILRTSTDSIRFYERKGLVRPTTKSRLGYRLYDREALRSLNYIKQAQRCGFSLQEIGTMLTARAEGRARCYAMYQLAVRKRKELQEKVEALNDMSRARGAD